MTGAKYWVLFYRNPELPPEIGGGHMGSIKFKDFCYWDEHILNNSFRAEAVVLRPGMIL